MGGEGGGQGDNYENFIPEKKKKLAMDWRPVSVFTSGT